VINVLQQTPRPVCDSQPFSAERRWLKWLLSVTLSAEIWEAERVVPHIETSVLEMVTNKVQANQLHVLCSLYSYRVMKVQFCSADIHLTSDVQLCLSVVRLNVETIAESLMVTDSGTCRNLGERDFPWYRFYKHKHLGHHASLSATVSLQADSWLWLPVYLYSEVLGVRYEDFLILKLIASWRW